MPGSKPDIGHVDKMRKISEMADKILKLTKKPEKTFPVPPPKPSRDKMPRRDTPRHGRDFLESY